MTLVAGALAVAVAAWSVWPTDERAVRARVTTLVGVLNTETSETDLQRMARAATLASGLAPDVVVTIDENRRATGREMVLGMARQALQTRTGLRVEIDRLEVRLGAGQKTASAEATLRGDDGTYHDVRLHLVKPGGTWLVQKAEVVRPLVRP